MSPFVCASNFDLSVGFIEERVVEDVDPYGFDGLILIICSHFAINAAIIGI